MRFDAVAAMYRVRLLAFVRTRLGERLARRTEPEDVLQETLLTAFESLDRFEWRGERSLFSWLATIAEYEIRGLGRGRRPDPLELDRDVAGSAPSPSRVLRREERLARLERALDVLEEPHRTVVRLVRARRT